MKQVCGKGEKNMKIRKSLGENIFNMFNILFMAVLMFVTLYPLWHVAMASISDGTEVMKYRGPIFLPLGFSTGAYHVVFQNPMISRGYLNTLFVVFVGVTLNIIMTSLGAYFLSRKGVMLKKPIMMAIVFTMFFSGGLIPFYLTVKDLHLDNSLWSLIIPGIISTFNLIIMRTAFMAIPDSLEESAKIDGASHFTILSRIIIPLAAPTIAVMVLYYGVGHWNSWFNAMVFLRKRELFPLQLILREILIQNSSGDVTSQAIDQEKASETVKYAVIIVATLPILFVYPFLQKYFVKGVMIGAVKE
jgi:putative aldouronate transport system permease protein